MSDRDQASIMDRPDGATTPLGNQPDQGEAKSLMGEGLAQELLDLSPDGIALVNISGRIIFANQAQRRLCGETLGTLVGTSLWDWILQSKVNHRKAVLKQVADGAEPVCLIDQCGDAWNEITFSPISANGGAELIAIRTRDITRQINAEEKLKRMTLQLFTLQEDERRRISQDLHDDIGQNLTALILSLKAIDGTPDDEGKGSSNQVKDAIRIAETLIKRVRQVSYQLRPPSLDTMPLTRALGYFCASFGQQSGLHVDYSSQDDLPRLSDVYATALYRLVQEGLNNVVNHAHATSVWVNLDYTQGEVSISLEDNGQGFDPQVNHSSMGLDGIRGRFLTLGGSFDIESSPGKGTRLFGSLPVASRL